MAYFTLQPSGSLPVNTGPSTIPASDPSAQPNIGMVSIPSGPPGFDTTILGLSFKSYRFTIIFPVALNFVFGSNPDLGVSVTLAIITYSLLPSKSSKSLFLALGTTYIFPLSLILKITDSLSPFSGWYICPLFSGSGSITHVKL